MSYITRDDGAVSALRRLVADLWCEALERWLTEHLGPTHTVTVTSSPAWEKVLLKCRCGCGSRVDLTVNMDGVLVLVAKPPLPAMTFSNCDVDVPFLRTGDRLVNLED